MHLRKRDNLKARGIEKIERERGCKRVRNKEKLRK